MASSYILSVKKRSLSVTDGLVKNLEAENVSVNYMYLGSVSTSMHLKGIPTLSVSDSGQCWSMVMPGNGSGTDFQASPLTSIGRCRRC